MGSGRRNNFSTFHASPPALALVSLTENTELSVARLALEPCMRIRPASGGSLSKSRLFTNNFFKKIKRLFLIAEIGVNHDGSLSKAKRLIIAAHKAGANCVKIQSFKATKIVYKNTPQAEYQIKNTGKKECQQVMLKKLELSPADQSALWQFAKRQGIPLVSTPYDLDSARFLWKLGIPFFKTASADLTDHPLHSFLAQTGKPVLISVGMATLEEIMSTLRIYRKFKNPNVAVLHCVANYPCSAKSLNLRVIQLLRKKLKVPVGFSDHSKDDLAATVAKALGCMIFEKHFTLNKNSLGPDHKASSNPAEFQRLRKKLLQVDIILGRAIKQCQPEEREMRVKARKSIYLAKNIKKNEKIKIKDLILRRPGDGLWGDSFARVIGKKAVRNLQKDSLIAIKDLK